MSDLSVFATATKAADLLEQRGHCKYSLMDYSGAMCANGAIGVALNFGIEAGGIHGYAATPEEGRAFHQTQRALADVIGLPYQEMVPAWNNQLDRTADEVINAFREVAQIEAEKTYADNLIATAFRDIAVGTSTADEAADALTELVGV